MLNKFIKLRGIGFLVFILLAFNSYAYAQNFNFQMVPTISGLTVYESGSNLFRLRTQINTDGSDRWLSGISCNIGREIRGYDTSIFEATNRRDLLAGGWGGINTPLSYDNATGDVVFTRNPAPGTPIGDASEGLTVRGAWQNVYQIDFHIRDNLTGSNSTIQFSQVSPAGENIAVQNWDPVNSLAQTSLTITVQAPAPPTGFAGIASVDDPGTGNTLTVNWNALSNVISEADQTPPIVYDIFRDVNPLPTGAALNGFRLPAASGIAGRSAPGSEIGGAAGSASFVDTGLSDGVTYYYKIRAKDSTTPNADALDLHRTTYTDGLEFSQTPNDLTPPPAITGVSVTRVADRTINLRWDVSPAAGGYIIIRRAGAPVTILDAANSLGRASGNADGPAPSANYARGTTYSDGIVVEHITDRNTITFSDFLRNGENAALDLVNGTQYFYTVIAYDQAVAGPPREQGFNYSDVAAASVTSGMPGVAPAPVTNFTAVPGGPGQIILAWNNSTSDFFQGILIRYVIIANPSDADQMASWDAMDARDGAGDLTLATGATLIDWARPAAGNPGAATEERVSITLSADAAGTPFAEGTTYYFMAFAHNGSGRHADGVKASATPGITPGVGSVSNLRIQVDPASGNTTLTFTPVTLAAGRVIEAYASTLPQGPFDADPAIGTDADGDGSITVSDGAILERYYKVRVSDGGPWSPETVGKIRLSLSTGINSVAIPFVTTVSGNSPGWTEMTADGLKAAADGVAPAVTYVAGWAGNQSEFARLYNPAAPTDPPVDVGGAGNFNIEPEIGYQVNVNAPKSWWVVGQR